jgi:hypothetical protein
VRRRPDPPPLRLVAEEALALPAGSAVLQLLRRSKAVAGWMDIIEARRAFEQFIVNETPGEALRRVAQRMGRSQRTIRRYVYGK